MNYLKSRSDLLKIAKENNIALYGAGNNSVAVSSFLKKKGINIVCIIVTDIKKNPTSIMNIPIVSAKKALKKYNWDFLIVATEEKYHDEIYKTIKEYKMCKNLFFITTNLLNNLKLNNEDIMFDMISFLNEKIDCIVKKTNKLEEHLLKFVKRPCMEYMIINILDHCNLKCKGCDHFACIADEHFVSVEQIQKDVNRLSKIMSSDYIVSIGVMGGEPLLHPDLLLILRVIRKAFPLAIIRLTTNGILLMKQEDEFWKCCNDNRITIVNTKYPINLPYEEIEKKANEKNVYYKYFEGTELSKKSFKKQIDLNGKNDIVKSFAHCIISNYGNFLMEGKLYSCPFSCQAARIFNKKFNLNLHLSEDDYLDIYKVNNKEEIFEFAARPKYFCRYCSDIIESFEWERSNFSMNEWV